MIFSAKQLKAHLDSQQTVYVDFVSRAVGRTGGRLIGVGRKYCTLDQIKGFRS